MYLNVMEMNTLLFILLAHAANKKETERKFVCNWNSANWEKFHFKTKIQVLMTLINL